MSASRLIVMLSLVLMAKGLLLLLVFGLLVWQPLDTLLPTIMTRTLLIGHIRNPIEASGLLIVGLFIVIGAISMLRLRGWGWLLTMIGLGIDLMLGLIDYAIGNPNYLSMLINVLFVFVLNRREVYVVFASVHRRDGALQVGSEENL